MPPVPLTQLIPPNPRFDWLTFRVTNKVLVGPLFGAFFEAVGTHRAPSLGWLFLLLTAAALTRVHNARSVVRERPVLLGVDGLLAGERFVPVAEILRVTQADATLSITTRLGERFELRAAAADVVQATAIAEAVRRVTTSNEGRDPAGERLLTELDAELPPQGNAYRALRVDDTRCLAIAEDVAAAPAARLAAARRLAGHPDGGVRVRIAEVAETTANPELREALLDTSGPALRSFRSR